MWLFLLMSTSTHLLLLPDLLLGEEMNSLLPLLLALELSSSIDKSMTFSGGLLAGINRE